MRIKDVLISPDRSVISFTSVRPLGDEHFDLLVKMNGDYISEIHDGSVIAKGQWMNLDEYCEYEEVKEEYNDAVKKGTIQYSEERVPDVKSHYVTELCPNCEHEITMVWNVNDLGYRAFCPVCGEQMMLCDECVHAEDGLNENCSSCDWQEHDDGTSRCFRIRKETDDDS